jgi:flagellar export protein FliJ
LLQLRSRAVRRAQIALAQSMAETQSSQAELDARVSAHAAALQALQGATDVGALMALHEHAQGLGRRIQRAAEDLRRAKERQGQCAQALSAARLAEKQMETLLQHRTLAVAAARNKVEQREQDERNQVRGVE